MVKEGSTVRKWIFGYGSVFGVTKCGDFEYMNWFLILVSNCGKIGWVRYGNGYQIRLCMRGVKMCGVLLWALSVEKWGDLCRME